VARDRSGGCVIWPSGAYGREEQPPGPCKLSPATRQRSSAETGSGLAVGPQAPAWFGSQGHGRRVGRIIRRSCRSTDLDLDLDLDLDELEQPNGRSILAWLKRPRRRRAGWRRGRRAGSVERFPAGPDLIASKRLALTVQPAIPELGGDRSPEVTAGSASGARSVADPASRRFCLGCRAVRTTPHRHGRMVAATGVRVDPSADPVGRPCPARRAWVMQQRIIQEVSPFSGPALHVDIGGRHARIV
jgi:hypothetical protein